MQVILITPPATLPHEPQTVNSLFRSGLASLHLRKPDADAGRVRQYLRQIEPQFLGRVVLHQHHDLAAEFPIKGIHFKERDRPPPPLPPPPRPGLTQSTSLHTTADLLLDWQHLDYAFLSPVFDSISKQGYLAAGFDAAELAAALRAAPMPVFALGGVTPDRVAAVRGMGFAGVGVLGAVWGRGGPTGAVDGLREFLDECGRWRR